MSLRNTVRRTAELRREAAKRAAALYGPLLADVTFLRRRGFVLYAEGKRLRLDNRLVSRTRLRDIAARERRLIKHATAHTRGDA